MRNPNDSVLCPNCGCLCKRHEQQDKTGWCPECVRIQHDIWADEDMDRMKLQGRESQHDRSTRIQERKEGRNIRNH